MPVKNVSVLQVTCVIFFISRSVELQLRTKDLVKLPGPSILLGQLAGPAGCPETSAWDYNSPLCKTPNSADPIDITTEARNEACYVSAPFYSQDGHNVNIRTVNT